MISAIYIFSVKGELLLQRVYSPPGPPHSHLKALARSLMANRAFGEFAPVICVGRGNSSAGVSESPAGISSFTWFMPPRTSLGAVGFFPSVVLSTNSSPVSNSGPASAAGQSSAAHFRQGARRRYGGAPIDENGIIYVAALRQNGNVACALEVLRRLAALVQAFFTAALHAGEDVGGSSLPPPSTLSRVSSPAGTTFRSQRGVSVDADADKRNANADAADTVTRAKTTPSSWQKMRRGLSVPRESATASRAKTDTTGTEGALMPAASISPLVTTDYAHGAIGEGGSRGDYGGVVTEMFIRKNFVLLHELLDEAVDGGYPQLLDLTALKQFIFLGSSGGIGSHVGSLLPAWAADLLGMGSGAGGSQPVSGGAALGSSSSGPFGSLSLKRGGDRSMGALQDVLQSRKITSQITSSCAWRPPGIKYRNNEVFVDVVECVNVLISQNGVVLRADVSGQVIINCKLSGMPECKFGLNDRVVAAGGGGTNPSSSGSAAAENSSAATRRHTHTQPQARSSSQSGSVKQAPGQATDPGAPPGASAVGRAQKNEAHQQQPTDSKKPGGVVLDDCRLHQCVRLAKYESERVVTFIPPDGVFQLMSYRYGTSRISQRECIKLGLCTDIQKNA